MLFCVFLVQSSNYEKKNKTRKEEIYIYISIQEKRREMMMIEKARKRLKKRGGRESERGRAILLTSGGCCVRGGFVMFDRLYDETEGRID
jgi:hypothetical protein